MSLKSFFHKALTEAGSVLSIIPAVGPLIGGAVEEVGSMIDPVGSASQDYNKAVTAANNMVTAAGLVAEDRHARQYNQVQLSHPHFFQRSQSGCFMPAALLLFSADIYYLKNEKDEHLHNRD